MAEKEQFEEKLMFLSQIAGELAHELKNPLSTIGLNIQLLIEDCKEQQESEKTIKRLDRIKLEVDRLDRLLNDFLKIIRGYKLEPVKIELNHLIEEILIFLEPEATRKNIRILPIYSKAKLIVNVDRNQMKQAIINVILNSIQATHSNGDIFIKIYKREKDAVIEIIDTGCGIKKENLNKIFDPFFTTKENGTGLGLAATKRIIEEHAGSIKVFSEQGKGTQFLIFIKSHSGN
ncbi:MAG: ATP-binding protein [Candidatus Hydrogenedentota bacterium]